MAANKDFQNRFLGDSSSRRVTTKYVVGERGGETAATGATGVFSKVDMALNVVLAGLSELAGWVKVNAHLRVVVG